MNHIELLKNLETIGINREYDVSSFMAAHFEPPNYNPVTEGWDDKLQTAKDFLLDLKELQYISINLYQLDEIKFLEDSNPQWFSNEFPVNVRIRVKGVEYLHQYRMLKATRWNFGSQLLITGMSMLAAFGSVFVAWLTYDYALIKNKDSGKKRPPLSIETSPTSSPQISPLQLGKKSSVPYPTPPPSSLDTGRKTP